MHRFGFTIIRRRRINVLDQRVSGEDNRFGLYERCCPSGSAAARSSRYRSTPFPPSPRAILRRIDLLSSGRAFFLQHEMLYRQETLLLLHATGRNATSRHPERCRPMPRRLLLPAGAAPAAPLRILHSPDSWPFCRTDRSPASFLTCHRERQGPRICTPRKTSPSC